MVLDDSKNGNDNRNDSDDIVITLDSKRLIVIGLIAAVAVFSLYSYVGALFAFIAPSQDLPIHINAVETSDGAGNIKSSFTRGSLVLINATIEKGTSYYYNTEYYYQYYYSFKEPTSYLLLIQVMHGDEPVFLGFVSKQISAGELESVGVGYRIAERADRGDYTANVYVWSTWLDQGGTVLADNSGQQVTFTVS